MTDTPTPAQKLDTRLTLLERDMKQVVETILPRMDNKLDSIGNAMNNLQSEPQQSPLGRALLSRADANMARIERNTTRLDSLEDWRSEMTGAAKVTRYIQIILGIAVGLITLYQVAKPG
jgi:hypothetical protein